MTNNKLTSVEIIDGALSGTIAPDNLADSYAQLSLAEQAYVLQEIHKAEADDGDYGPLLDALQGLHPVIVGQQSQQADADSANTGMDDSMDAQSMDDDHAGGDREDTIMAELLNNTEADMIEQADPLDLTTIEQPCGPVYPVGTWQRGPNER